MSFTTGNAFLSASQIEQFDKEGYVKIPGLITKEWVGQMNHVLDEYIQSGKTALNEGSFGKKVKEQHTLVTSIRNVCNLKTHQFLALLGCPEVTMKIESLCGEDFVPVHDFAVIKYQNDGEKVDWHQDLITQRTGRSIMFGLYLDSSNAQEGALEVIPRSQTKKQDICLLSKNPKNTQVIQMEAGDVLIHDPMIVHRSGPLTHHPVRRVLYFQCIPLHQLHNEKLYSNQLINYRLQLKSLAKEFYHYQDEKILRPILDEIYSCPAELNSANFCKKAA